jgi:hypothetical protein
LLLCHWEIPLTPFTIKIIIIMIKTIKNNTGIIENIVSDKPLSKKLFFNAIKHLPK